MKSKHWDTTGQSTIEYALLLSLAIVAVILGLRAMGVSTQDVYCRASSILGSDASSCTHYFEDDFSDLDAWDVVRGDWRLENGQLCGGPGEGRIFTDVEADDYVINIDSAALFKGNGYGVFFRVTNTPKFNGYSFQFDPGFRKGAFIFRKWVRGRELWPPFAIARARGYDWWNTPRQVQLVIQGDTFTVYIDGVSVLSASDDTYSTGGIGLRTWNGTTACFDDLSVEPVP